MLLKKGTSVRNKYKLINLEEIVIMQNYSHCNA